MIWLLLLVDICRHMLDEIAARRLRRLPFADAVVFLCEHNSDTFPLACAATMDVVRNTLGPDCEPKFFECGLAS